VIGGALLAAPNLLSINQVDPWLTGWALTINVALDKLKNEPWFPESWTPIILIIVGIGICWVIYAILSQEEAKVALGKGAWLVGQAHGNWVGGKRLGAFAPTAPEKRFAVNHPNARIGKFHIV
jgi:hypothetical protein